LLPLAPDLDPGDEQDCFCTMRSLAKDAPDASLLNPQSRSNPAQCGSMLIAPSPSPVVVTFKAAAEPRSVWQLHRDAGRHGWPTATLAQQRQ